MPRKTALADEIAALLNPTPAEQDDDEFVSSSQKSLGLLGDDDVTVQKQSGRRMRAAIDMSSTGAKYAGRVTTRDALDRRHRLPSKPQRAEEEEEDGEEEEKEEEEKEEEDEEGRTITVGVNHRRKCAAPR